MVWLRTHKHEKTLKRKESEFKSGGSSKSGQMYKEYIELRNSYHKLIKAKRDGFYNDLLEKNKYDKNKFTKF